MALLAAAVVVLSVPAGAFAGAAVVESTPGTISGTDTFTHAFLNQSFTGPTFTAKVTSGGASCTGGGTPWSVTGGTGLPPGVTIDGATGVISGTPAAPASRVRNYTFSVKWTPPGGSNCGNKTTATIYTLPVVRTFSGSPMDTDGNLTPVITSATSAYFSDSIHNKVFQITGANTDDPTSLSVTEITSTFPALSLNGPQGLAVTSGGSVFATNIFASGTKQLAQSAPPAGGRSIDLSVASNVCVNAAGVAVTTSGTYAFVTCPGSNKVYQVNVSTGVVAGQLTLPGTSPRPSGVVAVPRTTAYTNDVLVADARNDVVYWIDGSGGGNPVVKTGVGDTSVALDTGCVPANMVTSNPVSTATGMDHLDGWVACPGLGKIERFDIDTRDQVAGSRPDLDPLASFSEGASSLSRPYGLDYDQATDTLIVANSGAAAGSTAADRDVRVMTSSGGSPVPVQLGANSTPAGVALISGVGSPAHAVAYVTDMSETTASVWVVDPPALPKGSKKARAASTRRAAHRRALKRHRRLSHRARAARASALARNIAELRANAAINPLRAPR